MCELVLQYLEGAPSMFNRIVAMFMICIFFTSCQTVSVDDSNNNYTPNPQPYNSDELPTWTKDLRRAEIVTLGSIPFTVLISTMGYGVVQYASSGFSSDNIPNPFSPSLSSNEQVTVMITAASLSLAVGIGDFIISMVKRKNEEKRAALEKEDKGNITIEKHGSSE